MSIQHLSQQALLDTRICDLRLKLPAKYQLASKEIHQKLSQKGIKWKPFFWLADEWYVPDGVGGVAIPFVLAHPKLIALEKKVIGFCEGSNLKQFKKLYAHEIGHAIDNAFYLRLKKKRQSLFGKTSTRYPYSYIPDLKSKNYVHHLPDFYAQAHPDEDWAETFAVWLTQANWRQKYKTTLAFKKLEYVDMIMNTTCKERLHKITVSTPSDYGTDKRTVREYLQAKRKMYGLDIPSIFASELKKTFVEYKTSVPAHIFLKKRQKNIVQQLSVKKKYHPWVINKCLQEMSFLCREKKLHLKHNPSLTEKRLIHTLDKQYDNYIRKGRTRVFM